MAKRERLRVTGAGVARAWLAGLLCSSVASLLGAGGDSEAAKAAGTATAARVSVDATAGTAGCATGSPAGGVAVATRAGASPSPLVAPRMAIDTVRNPSATAKPAPTNPGHRRRAERFLRPPSSGLRSERLNRTVSRPSSEGAANSSGPCFEPPWGLPWGPLFSLSLSKGNAKRTRVS